MFYQDQLMSQNIKLKRCLGYKHHYQFQNFRPSKVLEVAQYLVRTSKLFKIGTQCVHVASQRKHH